jgi:prolyl oligopeptidase
MSRFVAKWVRGVCLLGAVVGVLKLRATDYPPARRAPDFDDYFGQKIQDPYRWMEDIDSPRTLRWIAAERAYTAAAFAEMPEANALRGRLKELWNFPRYGLPKKRGGRVFFMRNDGLQNQSVLCVVDRAGAAPRVLVDPNEQAADGTVAVSDFAPTADGSLVGYGLAKAGSDWREIHVLDVATGKEAPDVLHWVKFSTTAWTGTSGFFYTRYPEPAKGNSLFETLSGRRLYYHTLGSDQAADQLIFEIPEHPDWDFASKVTDDGRYLVLTVQPNARTQKAIYYLDLGDPKAPRVDRAVVKLLDKFDADYAFAGNSGARFYVRTTRDAPRGKVVAIDLGSPDGPSWRTVVPETGDSIEGAILAGGKLVVWTLHDVQSRLAAFGADGSPAGEVRLPGIGAVSGLTGEAGDPEIYYGFSSFLTPPSVLVHNAETGSDAVFQAPSTPFDPSPYETKEVFYRSADGTRIPLFVTAKKGLKLDGSAPAWLYGYGGFNIAIMPAFSVSTAVWLEMGGIYAQASIRGGSEYGEAWHLAGTKERKQNVFNDFIAAADYLVAQGYTQRDRLVIEGRSNGGLLVAAVINQRPDLCAVALPAVGVMDMLRYHKFTIGATWASDYGTSEDPAGFKYLLAYSPIHNAVYGGKYPAVLITTGDHDDRVFPAHSFKYAAAMQAAIRTTPYERPILIRIDSNAGHGGSSGTAPVSKTIDEWADRMGFAAHFMPVGTLTLPKAP